MKETILAIISGVEKELENLVELQREMQRVKLEKEIVFQRSKGSILHDFYNCCERVFKKIAIEINSGYEESEKWHKNLLYQMTTPIEGIRPRVISDELAADLDEFLAFRHLFRNIYGFELKGSRIDYLVGKFEKVAERFRKEAQDFLVYLRKNLDQPR
jgi:hypothetical protein